MTATAINLVAADSAALLDAVYTFMTTNTDLVTASEEWVSDLYVAGQEFIIHSPQAGLTQDVYIGWRLVEDISPDVYNIEIRGFGGYSVGLTWDNQPVSMPKSVYLCSYNQPLNYWIVANHRRFIVIEKVSTVYLSAYCGLYAPYATPTQYAYPMYVAASTSIWNRRWSATSGISHAGRGVGANDIDVSAFAYFNGGWITVRCSVDGGTSTTGRVIILPFYWTNHRVITTKDTDGNYTVEDALIINDENPALAGILDGYGWVTGVGNTSESTLTFGGDTWLIIHDVFRTAINDYYAVRLV